MPCSRQLAIVSSFSYPITFNKSIHGTPLHPTLFRKKLGLQENSLFLLIIAQTIDRVYSLELSMKGGLKGHQNIGLRYTC